METLPVASVEVARVRRVPKTDYLEELAVFCSEQNWKVEIETKMDTNSPLPHPDVRYCCYLTIRKKYTFKTFSARGSSELEACQRASRRALERLTEVVQEAIIIKEY